MDDLKELNLNDLQPFYEGLDESKLANVDLRLSEGTTMTVKQRKRHLATLARVSKAAEQIGRLPARGESLHCILKGDFALFDFIPAALQLSGENIDELTIATLGFSKENVTRLDQMIDVGQIRSMSVLCSHYFAAADEPIYAQMAELCTRRKFRLCAMRSHAKLLLMAIGKRRLVVESSANLRSCHNCEQATVFDDPRLYDWHAQWVGELLTKGATR